MRKRMLALALCLVLAVALIPQAVSAAANISNKTLYASVGESVRFDCELSTAGSIDEEDASALRELGLDGTVNGKELTVSGTPSKAGQVQMKVSDVVLKIRVSGPEIPPKTGDENTPLLFMGLALMSLTGLILVAKKRRA